jgi:hypothetical protein
MLILVSLKEVDAIDASVYVGALIVNSTKAVNPSHVDGNVTSPHVAVIFCQ